MRFDRAFALVVLAEGGYVNDPRDPGGQTKFGISDRADGKIDGMVDLQHDGIGDVPVKTLTMAHAKQIYREFYWHQAKCDLMPPPLDIFMFDAAVNHGTGAAIRMLQVAVKTHVDGILGPATLLAVDADAEVPYRFMAERAIRYFGTNNFDRFGRGWLKRIFKLAREA